MSQQVQGKRVGQRVGIQSAERIGAAHLVAQFDAQMVQQRIGEIEGRQQLNLVGVAALNGGSSLADKGTVQS